MKTVMRLSFLSCLCALTFPALAFAHTVPGGGGFISGITHPVLGFDHLLAMVSVGILSAQLGGRAIWTVPATFVSVMVLGGVLGMADAGIPGVEFGIAFSVFALGIALAAEKHFSQLAAMVFVAIFAIFHGHAHGTEMPYVANPYLYACGFVMGSAGLHILGVFIGVFAKRDTSRNELLRFCGAGIAGIGFHILIA